MAEMDYKQLSQPYTGTVADLQNLLSPVRTTAQLAAIGNSINTKDKFVGKRVFDTTLGRPVYADAATAAGTWSLSTGVVSSSPS